ncbi:Uma2 family endonuclease [Streptomyces uncialis]|uniref:Uma2 family endonuclease n=1 Tax=Streptomyces uncialis TaxID=1048205 RepID=UPI0033F756DB
MTVVEIGRIEMAEQDTAGLDTLFEQMSAPEGYRVEVVGGDVYMTPQRSAHWEIIRWIVRALEDRFGMRVKVLSDVRIDFPGKQNGFAPDVAKLRDDAEPDQRGRWRHEDVEFVAEVISRGTAANDYGPKLAVYAEAEVPVYVIADPYQGRCRVHLDPKNGEYRTVTTVPFGEDLDLTTTPVALVLGTGTFPRD